MIIIKGISTFIISFSNRENGMGNICDAAVVAIFDTGVYKDHVDLKDNFRESYGWFDPYENTEDPPSSGSREYENLHPHGTHVAGIAVGSNGIGVAPTAKWIACMGFPNGFGKPWQVLACANWILNPRNERDGDTMAPDVVCCAWTSNVFKPPLDLELELRQSIEGWLTADIIPVFPMGNDGLRNGTILFPANMDQVISVGSVDLDDKIAKDSSRGTTTNLVKPNFVAPGVDIWSAYCKEKPYMKDSGTSLAAAHVAGAICVLLNMNIELSCDDIKEIFEKTTCRRKDIQIWPNVKYGYGRINVFKALQYAIKHYASSNNILNFE